MPLRAWIFVLGVAATLLIAAVGIHFAPSREWIVFFDNFHWTLCYLAAAGLAWLGYDKGKGVERTARLWFFIGLATMAFGQWLWDVQVYVGWNPFPAPSDFFYLMLGPSAIVGMMAALRYKLSPAERRMALLDTTAVSLALLAVVLTLYLPRSHHIEVFELAVFVAYPVFLLTAACVAILMVLQLRLRLDWGWVFFLAGLLGEGFFWMKWNAMTLDQTIEDGTLFNAGFSVAGPVLGLGAMLWRVRVSYDARYERLCEAVLRFLPLLVVVAASVAVVLVNTLEGVLPSVRYAVVVAMMAVLILAAIRQSMLLKERDRMLEAERKIVENQVRYEYLARHDPLTGLPNRMYFQTRLDEAMEIARKQNGNLALFYIDLDHFKNVNDSMGHPVGDALLVSITERISDAIGQHHFFARVGGDEFVLLMKASKYHEVVDATAQGILQQFEPPFTLTDGKEVFIGASIGISAFPDDASNAVDLVRNADSAMFQAKEGGRNNYCYYSAAMTYAALDRLNLEVKLRRSIEREEFTLHYQPQIGGNGNIVGVEALVRWESPEDGMISPDKFIPIAEQTGLIVPLGEWVIRTACRQLAAWLDAGLPDIRMAINISPRQMLDHKILDVLKDSLAASGVSGSLLTLEITEGAIMEQEENAISVLHAFKRLGVRIAVDDFGTGQSSLVKLKRLPVDELKIDRAFVRDIPDDANDMQIAATIIAMSQSLNLYVVAEGVETQDQYSFLYGQGCHYFQGYLFSRPLPAAELGMLLESAPVWHCTTEDVLEFRQRLRDNTA